MVEITKEMLEQLLEDKDVRKIIEIFDEYNIVDLAEIVNELSLGSTIDLMRILPSIHGGELFSYLDINLQKGILDALDPQRIKMIMDQLFSDDIVDFLKELPDQIQQKVMDSIEASDKQEIHTLLSYEENTAGAMMSTDFVELAQEDTIEKAMKKIKAQRKIAETVNYCYITDTHGVLVGCISLRDILFAPSNSLIGDVMENDVISVKVNEDQEEVTRTIQKYDFTIVPVVDPSNRLVGVITFDDVIDVIQEEATEDIHKMGGIMPVEDSYLNASPLTMAKSRLVWLLVLMVSYVISSLIITKNNELLTLVPSLITFVPMLMSTAGNAGSQSSAMTIRAITVDDLTMKDFPKVFMKELGVAAICGAILCVVNTLRIVLFVDGMGLDIAITVSLTIFFVVILSKLLGGFLPLFALSIKQDPAAMASPLITTAVDVLSLLVYFTLARVFLGV
ncbi:MAG: magnesium transporter [Erysipelotrichaceae bacterium]|nr:magnesium transporter [Erysipelotrichaceae bacterium]